jgi:hypothetical protein
VAEEWRRIAALTGGGRIVQTAVALRIVISSSSAADKPQKAKQLTLTASRVL